MFPCGRKACKDTFKRNPAGRMSLRIEHHLDMTDALINRLVEIGRCNLSEIVGTQQCLRSLRENGQEIVQTRHVVSGSCSLDAIEKFNSVLPSNSNNLLRGDTPLQMDVQFSLGQRANEGS